MTKLYASWSELRLEAERLFSTFVRRDTSEFTKSKFDAATIQNVIDFIEYAETHFPIADDINHGYWPTICLYWSDAKPYPIEVEIFGSDFELTRSVSLKVDTSQFDHVPGEPFPAELAEILSAELR